LLPAPAAPLFILPLPDAPEVPVAPEFDPVALDPVAPLFDPVVPDVELPVVPVVPLASELVPVDELPLSIGRFTTCCWLEPAFEPEPVVPSLQPAKANVSTTKPRVIFEVITNLLNLFAVETPNPRPLLCKCYAKRNF
jgi:hypothetical protein